MMPSIQRGLMWCITDNAASKCCYLVLENGFIKDLDKIWKNRRTSRKSARERTRDFVWHQWREGTLRSHLAHLRTPAAQRGGQNNSTSRDITAERCCGSLPAGKLNVWEKAQPIFLSGKPMKRNNSKGRGSKSEVVRKMKKGREKQSQLKFIIIVLHCYLIMNEDLIVLHPVQMQLRMKWFLPETTSISAEAWNCHHCSRTICKASK